MFRTSHSALLLTLALLGQTSPLFAQRYSSIRSTPEIQAVFREVVARPSQSTVRILCDDQPAALGTVMTADGYIVTKASELSGNIVCKFKNGRSLSATVVGIEDKHDLALLKVQATGLEPIQWRAAKLVDVGDWLAAPVPTRTRWRSAS